MRTTLTRDEAVAAAFEKRRSDRGTSEYTLPTFDPGRQLLTDIRTFTALMDAEDVERGLPVRT